MDLFALLTNLVHSEYFNTMLSTEMQTELSKYGIILGVMWLMMGKKVATHFKRLESSVSNMGVQLFELKIAVEKDLNANAKEMAMVKEDIKILKDLPSRVDRLEQEHKNKTNT